MLDPDPSSPQDLVENTYIGCQDTIEAARMIAIIGLGMCRALSGGAVSPAYACHRLFGPALLSWVQKLNVDADLVSSIHLATELEDVADIIPDKLAQSITRVEEGFLATLKELAERGAGEDWLRLIKRSANDELAPDTDA